MNYEFIHSRFTENARKTSVFIVTLMIDTQFDCALFHIKCKTKRGREYKVLAVWGESYDLSDEEFAFFVNGYSAVWFTVSVFFGKI